MLKLLTPADIIQRHIRQMEVALERMERRSAELGKTGLARIEKQVVIMDLSGLSLMPRGIALALFKETLRIDQE
eukprot:gene17023-34422_t